MAMTIISRMLWSRTQTEQENFKSSSRENHNMIPGISWWRLIGKVTVDDNTTGECLTRI